MEHRRLAQNLTLAALLSVVLILMIKAAWMSDDAYITLRTVDNFIHGYGLTWNIDERVQTYTHPLWMFLLSAAVFCTDEVYFTTITLSLCLSLIACVILALRHGSQSFMVFLTLSLLAASKAFIDYTSSGLEAPLLYLLAALFCAVMARGQHRERDVFLLGLLACLSGLTRLDSLLFYFPPLLSLILGAWEGNGRWRASLSAFWWIAAGFIPLGLWEFFSLFYYGFPLPNTAYAKLPAALGWQQYWRQGMNYYLDSMTIDPLTLGTIVLSIVIALVYRRRVMVAQAAGIVIYLIYVLGVGGDFMSGRFFALPFFMAVLLLGEAALPMTLTMGLGMLVFSVAVVHRESPLHYSSIDRKTYVPDSGVGDERGIYYQSSGLLTFTPGRPHPEHIWRAMGESLRAQNRGEPFVCEGIGFLGYFAGPHVKVVDLLGIGDPLLAHLPLDRAVALRVGHYRRRIPDGYLESLRTGQNRLGNPSLARYYADLRLATSGPLLSWERLFAIGRLNFCPPDNQ